MSDPAEVSQQQWSKVVGTILALEIKIKQKTKSVKGRAFITHLTKSTKNLLAQVALG